MTITTRGALRLALLEVEATLDVGASDEAVRRKVDALRGKRPSPSSRCTMTTAIEFVWRAMGEPAACETDGTEMRPLRLLEAISSRDTATAMGLAAELGVDTTSETWAAEATRLAAELLEAALAAGRRTA